ncbi:MAG TPA: hypothetical protein V6C63_11185 [Allocoleopsis sp.]
MMLFRFTIWHFAALALLLSLFFSVEHFPLSLWGCVVAIRNGVFQALVIAIFFEFLKKIV